MRRPTVALAPRARISYLALATTLALGTALVSAATFAAEVPSPESSSPESPRPVRDGRLFDPGIAFEKRAETAPEALDHLAGFIGDWRMEMELRRPGQDPILSEGRARVTYMNRGHAILERARIADFDGAGHPMATLAFYAVGATGSWTLSEANSWTESISLSSGNLADGRLVLHDALRAGGGPNLMLFRTTLAPAASEPPEGAPAFVRSFEISTDFGDSWATVVERRYFPAETTEGEEDFFPVREDDGLPSPDRAPEADQFDFLLGEFQATHWMNRQGTELRWQSTGTAVHALDGHAILEFDWHDNDPSLPDAATSIIRIYNRSMRHWESLFLSNRGSFALHFGGVLEGPGLDAGGRIVLHPFAAQTGSNPLSQWIFFDAEKDSYRWKGLRSQDRGATWPAYWTIDFVRKGSTAASDAP